MKIIKLLEPLKIGSMTIKNRFVIPAMHLNYAEGGYANEQLIEFYRRRAQGGTGFIIVGGVSVEKRGQGVPMMLSLDNDKYIPGMTQLTDAVHKEGAKICAQMYHAGAYAFSRLIGTQAISSSAVYSRFTHETPRALTTEEVVEVEQLIAQAAARAADANFDAVELLSSAGYLLDQFLSPIKNKRTDRYGGPTIEDRLTFPLELIDTVKEQVGSRIIIGIRLSGDDFVPGSNTYHEKVKIAKAYEEAGVKYINVTGGWHETRVPQIPMDTPRGAFTYLAKEVKNVVKIPVFASNRINDPLLGEELLRDFYADAICFGRASIADPDMPIKAQQARYKEIRHCIGCNQGCFDGIFNLQPLKCTVNPLAGYELRYSKTKKAKGKYKVVIVGAGPAGLEAAKVSAENGHDVVLFEKTSEIGGQVKVACVPPGREEIHDIIDYYEEKLDELNIDLRLNTKATVKKILEEEPDVVFFSNGVQFNIPNIKGVDGSQNCNIVFADEALAGEAIIGKRVAVIGGAATGVETAIWAAKKGAMKPEISRFLAFYKALPEVEAIRRSYKGDREVYLLEYLPKIASSVGKSTKWVFLQELKMLNVQVQTNVEIYEFKNNSIYYRDRPLIKKKDKNSDENNLENNDSETIDTELKEHVLENIDTIILATGVKSDRKLVEEFKEYIKKHKEEMKKVPQIKMLGDTKKVGTILDAVHSAFKAAYKLGKVEE